MSNAQPFQLIKDLLSKYLLKLDIYSINFEDKSRESIENLRKTWITTLLNEKNIKNNCNYFIQRLYENKMLLTYDEYIINILDFKEADDKNGMKKFFDLFSEENSEYFTILLLSIINIKSPNSYTDLIIKMKLFSIVYNHKNVFDDKQLQIFCYCFIEINWPIKDIEEFIKKVEKKINNEELLNLLLNEIKKVKLQLKTENNKKENIIDIINKYPEKDLELLIKQLCVIQEVINKTTDNPIENIINELKIRNEGKLSDEYLNHLKNMHKKILNKYDDYILSISSNKKIKNFEKLDIKKWAKSEHLKGIISNAKNNNDDYLIFLIESLAVIYRAYQLDTMSEKIPEGFKIRDVQLFSILIILLSPKNKGLFAQIKTGEGKSSIVAVLATVKALYNEYVDVLSSSIVLAQRDAKEKKSFYKIFGLSVSNTDKKNAYKKNIVYGDSMGFEGEILREIFHNEGKRLKNKKRGYRCIIIDEVDSICIDNLGSSTRLGCPFPSYSFLVLIYPYIYNNLNILESKNPNFKEDEIVNQLINVTREFISKSKENDYMIIPNNLKDYIEMQIEPWCREAYKAKHYQRENIDYVIAKDELPPKIIKKLKSHGIKVKDKYRISPVDYQNTGVVNLHMVWSDGLSQFLQIKHGLPLEPEGLTTTFLSHYNFLRLYISNDENNIYGVTGTLGAESSKKLLSELFEVNTCIVPSFRPSKMVYLKSRSEYKKKEDWIKEIINEIKINSERKRTILLICYSIEETEELFDALKKTGYPEYKMEKYQRNDLGELKKNLSSYEEGDVIFATNLAGRGTDIKLNEIVKNNGGMHVILTFLPNNTRIEDQATGRTARSGADGSGILIVNDEKKIESLKYQRDQIEDKRIDNIKNKELSHIKFMGELFQKFCQFYNEIKSQIIIKNTDDSDDSSDSNDSSDSDDSDTEKKSPKNFLENLFSCVNKSSFEELNLYNNAKLKDLEEKWGIWIKRNNLEKGNTNGKEEEILKKYIEFEEKMKKEILNDEINNPFTFLEGKHYSESVKRDKDCCFYGHYLGELQYLDDTKTDGSKNQGLKGIKKTLDIIKEKILPQVQGIECVSSLAKKNMICKQFKYLSKDIDYKLDSLQNLLKKLNENYQIIEGTLGNEKKILHLSMKGIKSIANNDFDNLNFLKDLGIDFYYEIEVETKKDYFGIFCIIFLGAIEFVGGCMLKLTLGNDFGLMKEGLADIKYGIDCLLGNKSFSWEEVGKRKLAYLINLAVSFAVGFITGQPIFDKPDVGVTNNSFKELVKEGAKEVGKHLAKEGAKYICKKVFGEELIKKVISEIKDFIENKCLKFFDEIIKSFLKKSNEFKQMLIYDVMNGVNQWEQGLSNEMKIYSRAFTSIIKTIVNTIIEVIKSIINGDNWEIALTNILRSTQNNLLNILSSGISDFLNNLKGKFFEFMKNFSDVSDKVCDKIKSVNDIIEKHCELSKNEVNGVISVLKQNNFINNMGVINGKKIFGDQYNQINDVPLKLISKFENCVDKFENIASNIQTNFSNNTNIIIDQGRNLINNTCNNINNINNNLNNNLNNSFNQILPLDNINFGKYNNKKEEIIKCLGKMRTKIDNFNIEEKCDEIIAKLKAYFINEITDVILEALNTDELKSFLGDIQNNYRNALDTASKNLNI